MGRAIKPLVKIGSMVHNRVDQLISRSKERGRSSGVEHNLAKVGVVSSNLIARSIDILLFLSSFCYVS